VRNSSASPSDGDGFGPPDGIRGSGRDDRGTRRSDVSGSGAATYNIILTKPPPDIAPPPSLEGQWLTINNDACRAGGTGHQTKVERVSWAISHGGMAIGVGMARRIADAWQCPVCIGINLTSVNASSYRGTRSRQSATPTGMKRRFLLGESVTE
jgi:hypothetical protein